MKNIIIIILTILAMIFSSLFPGGASFIPGNGYADDTSSEQQSEPSSRTVNLTEDLPSNEATGKKPAQKRAFLMHNDGRFRAFARNLLFFIKALDKLVYP